MADLNRLKKWHSVEFVSHSHKLHKDKSVLVTEACKAANSKKCFEEMNVALINTYYVLGTGTMLVNWIEITSIRVL